MLLKFVSRFLSIKEFREIDLPPFTVITGVNGAGKSHLLKAIAGGQVTLGNVRKSDIVLFSGETFRLDDQNPVSADNATQERIQAWQYLNQSSNPNLIGNFQAFRRQIASSGERIEAVSRALKKPIWKLTAQDGISEEDFVQLENYKNQVQDFLLSPQFNGNHQIQSIYVLCKKLDIFIDNITESKFYSLYEPRHYRENFLPTQITLALADYYSKWEENEYLRWRNSLGEANPVLSDEEFVAQNGPKPWDVINQVLSQFGSLPYRINSPQGLKRNEPFKAELIHQYDNEIRPNFSDLSSGEKILIALVVSVYKASSDRNFPKVLLLDEIDASLHPSMMENMLAIVNDVFVASGTTTILVSHSPTTVAICAEEAVHVMHPQGFNRIEHRTRESALDILTEGFVTLSKGLSVLDEAARRKVSVVTEGNNIAFVRRALEIAGISDVEVLSGVEDRTGSRQLKTLYDFFLKLPHDSKIIVAWDCDVERFAALPIENNTIPFVFPKNKANMTATRGIENIFPEELLDGFRKQITFASGKVQYEFDEGQKGRFAEFILGRNNPEDFAGFASFIALVRSLTDGGEAR